MGCAYSSNGRAIIQKFNDNLFLLPKKLFKVVNVDEEGTEVNQCQMEITDTELILYQKGRDTISWPIRAIRRYGYELNLFSFECGRQCQTGSGIYAFKCSKAEQLYNVLQEAVQKIHTAPKNDNIFDQTQSPPVLSIRSFQRGVAVQRMQDNPRFDVNEEFTAQTNLPFSFGLMNSTSCTNSIAADGVGFAGYANETYLNSPNYMNTTSNATSEKGTRVDGGRLSIAISPYRASLMKSQLEDGKSYANMKNQASNTTIPVREVPIPACLHQQIPSLIENISPSQDENVNYTLLDLDVRDGATIVTTVPVTPISKNGGNDFSQISPPHTPGFGKENVFTLNRQPQLPYSSIDFDKTEAFKKTAEELNKQHRYSHSMATKIQD